MEKVEKLIFLFLVFSTLAFSVSLIEQVQNSIVEYVLLRFGEDATITNLQFRQKVPEANNFEILSFNISGGKVNLLIKFCQDNIFSGYVQAVANVAVFRNVLVACRTIKSGEVIKLEDVSLVKMNVFGNNGQFTDRHENIVGRLSKKMFKEGEPIDLFYLTKPPDVKLGQVLPATIQIGSVVVTTLVRVVQDGNFGEIIRARNLSTGFLIHGVLKEDYSINVIGS